MLKKWFCVSGIALAVSITTTACVRTSMGKTIHGIFGDYGTVSAEKLSQVLAAQPKKWTVVDVRPWEAYNEGHIPGAINIPFGGLTQQMKNISKWKEAVLYCENATTVLSNEAAKLLTQNGYSRIHILENGLQSWKDKGLPLTSGEKP